MSAQPDIERYLNHVADRFELRQHFRFGTRVVAATFDESTDRWTIETDRGDTFVAPWCVMATGSLSASRTSRMTIQETGSAPMAMRIGSSMSMA